MTIGGYSFEGLYPGTMRLLDRSGVYVILDHQKDGRYAFLDVGNPRTSKRGLMLTIERIAGEKTVREL